MAQKTGMRVIGAVENMSYLAGTGQELFGSGGGEALAAEVGAPLLGRIPLDPALLAADELTEVERVVRAAFGTRRKTLPNALRTGLDR